jgi:RNA polymerase sigma factor for flagellar operon FliA
MGVAHEELWTRWRQRGETAARDQLVETYVWLVRYVAGRLMMGLPPHFDQGDVEGHGCFGLLEAVARFDTERGVRFETFAIPWVRGACLEGIRSLQWAPALRKRVRQLDKAGALLMEELGREPSHAELAAHMGISLDECERRVSEVGCLSLLSLEEGLVDPGGETVTMGERLADPNAPDPESLSEEADRAERLQRALDGLTEQERLVVTLFYHEGLTAKEISEVLRLSQARISQIHSRAIMRLRGKLAREKAQLVS